tara:strand:- start:1526 stop:1930 length:405 start_codon:yes stop_codon:yes gene_type:complete
MPNCNICNCNVTKRCSKKINEIDYKICKNCKDNIQKTQKEAKPKPKPGPKATPKATPKPKPTPKSKPGPKPGPKSTPKAIPKATPKPKPGPKPGRKSIQTQAVRLGNRIVYFPKVPNLPIFPKVPTDKIKFNKK